MENLAKLLSPIIFIFLMACGAKQSSEVKMTPAEAQAILENELQEKLIGEIMSIHDEVMPKMSEISTLKRGLKIKMDSLLADNLKANDELGFQLKEQVENLGGANESMMNWMHGFSKEFGNKSHKEIIEYLEDQKIKAQEVKDKMNTAIKMALSSD